jgi:tRNA threonylcarbamoyladenosine biosynthesis protein TsaB
MNILAVDTALGACSAAVLVDGAVRAHRLVVMERGHAEALAPMVQSVMQDARLRLSEIDRLAVTTGPGTFTGQRVGLAFMRGLRVALRRPLTGITTLQAMAAAAMAESGSGYGAALHDAKRAEVYVGLYGHDETLLEPALLAAEEAVAAIRQKMAGEGQPPALAGTAAPLVAKAFGNGAILTSIVYPDAVWVARLALQMPETSEPPRPLYLRPPDARLPAPPA